MNYNVFDKIVNLSLTLFLEWKVSATRCILDMQTSKAKGGKEDIMRTLRDKADTIYKEVIISLHLTCN